MSYTTIVTQGVYLLKGRYLPVYATAIYDQNAELEEEGITPVNLKSVLIGKPLK